jgi:microsomal dipeptidase-like Zn-dependent dipeptidase
MIVDLHSHYPMHLVPGGPGDPLDVLASKAARRRLSDRIRARLVGLASRVANYRSFDAGPSVTVEALRAGDVGVALSVLYCAFAELDDRDPFHGTPPEHDYFGELIRQLELVEHEIATDHAGTAAIAHDVAELDALLAEGTRTALVHCVEGGFHLGATTDEVGANIAELARRGVAYVTVAHLLYREVATNAPALPFLSDRAYHFLFRQPDRGLSALGDAAVRAMAQHGVLIDITHMSERSIADVFAILDEIDPHRRVPVIASHMACRLGKLEYNFADATLEAIAARNGVMGMIACEHYATSGVRPTKSFDDTVEVLCAHLERIRSVTGSIEHAAIGSDLDGFIKPTMKGLETMDGFAQLQAALVARLGPDDARKVCSDNALRVLRAGWGQTL